MPKVKVHLNNNLSRNLFTTSIGRFGSMIIQLATTLVLARFLSPADFGVVAMCTIFLSISEMLVDSGMGGSLVFHNDVKKIELDTLFWTNLSISFIIYVMLFFSSSSIAEFYGSEILESMIKIIALSTIIHSLCIVQASLLTKELKFAIQAKIQFCSALVSGIFAVVLAYFNFGIWSLVLQPILMKLVQVIMYFSLRTYFPSCQFSFKSLKKHWLFGSKLLGSSVIKLLYDNIYVQIIGKNVNIYQAGFFAQAKKFNDVPTNLMTSTLDKVIFPSLVNLDDKIPKMNQLSQGLSTLIVPLLFLLALVSNEFVLIFLGEKWMESGWMLSFMFLGSIGLALESLNRCFLKASGKISILLKFDLMKRTIGIIIIFISLIWGIKGLLIAFIINGFLGWLFNCYALHVSIAYTLRQQIFYPISIIFIALACYLLISYTAPLLVVSILVSLLIKSVVMISLYLLFLYFLYRNRVMFLFQLFKKKS